MEIGVIRNDINFLKMRGFDMRNDFTMFKRTVPSGKEVVYYYAYDANGIRKGPWTTHCRTITEARNFCHRLIKNGILVPEKNILTFGEFAKDFWEEDSKYVKYITSRFDISKNTLNLNKSMTANQIIPFFGDLPLDRITDKEIDGWLLDFKNRGVMDEKNGEFKNYKNSYANTSFSVLGVMLGEAVRQGLIKSNPCKIVKRLKDDTKKSKILSLDEVRQLFPKNNRMKHWNREVAFAANFLASITGMRIGEVLGLRGEHVHDDYIYVCCQYGQYGYIDTTKTKENRSIPLMPEMIAILRSLMKSNGQGYLFSLNGGVSPVCRDYLYDELHRALEKIGISDKERRERGLKFHSWRHFLNTDLLTQGMSIPQVQGVTGHKSKKMTDHYNHMDARSIPDVIKAQEAIAEVDRDEEIESESVPALKLVKKTKDEYVPEQKLA